MSALAFDDAAARPRSGWTTSGWGPSSGPGAAAQPALRRFPAREVGLRSFRTVRHATQLAWLHAVGRSDDRRADARFMLRRVRARAGPASGHLRPWPRRPRLQLPPRAVPGRLRRLPAGAAGHSRAYPYRSKACLANLRPYLLAARHDTLLPTIEALQA